MVTLLLRQRFDRPPLPRFECEDGQSSVARRRESLFDKVVQKEEAETELERCTMAVYVIKEEDHLQPPHDIGIVIERVQVLSELPSVPHACAMLFGLIYALNLSYPTGAERLVAQQQQHCQVRKRAHLLVVDDVHVTVCMSED
ncbi:Hypothetical protein SMAX5B_016678 [Scophthalmus maximus]|uniref:Uncharacterized protein n=1 Tax=Scophthalmus maximus TaxID=52904 RepID=A0A2U9CNA1_SCOMX|nr:Hypothetical protein SMAX5B_016678 [Scophthalmus maximus]